MTTRQTTWFPAPGTKTSNPLGHLFQNSQPTYLDTYIQRENSWQKICLDFSREFFSPFAFKGVGGSWLAWYIMWISQKDSLPKRVTGNNPYLAQRCWSFASSGQERICRILCAILLLYRQSNCNFFFNTKHLNLGICAQTNCYPPHTT